MSNKRVGFPVTLDLVNAERNQIYGKNLLGGKAGHDALYGRGGADRMIGGNDDDVYCPDGDGVAAQIASFRFQSGAPVAGDFTVA